MGKKLASLFIFIFLVIWSPGPVLAQTINEDIDQDIAELWPQIIAKQNEYQKMTGRYFQGLDTHFTIPQDGKGEYPEGWYIHPTDQQYRWIDIGIFEFKEVPYSARIDTYDGPEGQGWVLIVKVVINKNVYQKSYNYGPEALRGSAWEIIRPEAEEG